MLVVRWAPRLHAVGHPIGYAVGPLLPHQRGLAGLFCGWSYVRPLRYQMDYLRLVGELTAPLPHPQAGHVENDGMGPSNLLSGVWTFESSNERWATRAPRPLL